VSARAPGDVRNYVRVTIIWLLVLAALFGLQSYFS
jgi:hypothetical protein